MSTELLKLSAERALQLQAIAEVVDHQRCRRLAYAAGSSRVHRPLPALVTCSCGRSYRPGRDWTHEHCADCIAPLEPLMPHCSPCCVWPAGHCPRHDGDGDGAGARLLASIEDD